MAENRLLTEQVQIEMNRILSVVRQHPGGEALIIAEGVRDAYNGASDPAHREAFSNLAGRMFANALFDADENTYQTEASQILREIADADSKSIGAVAELASRAFEETRHKSPAALLVTPMVNYIVQQSHDPLATLKNIAHGYGATLQNLANTLGPDQKARLAQIYMLPYAERMRALTGMGVQDAFNVASLAAPALAIEKTSLGATLSGTAANLPAKFKNLIPETGALTRPELVAAVVGTLPGGSEPAISAQPMAMSGQASGDNDGNQVGNATKNQVLAVAAPPAATLSIPKLGVITDRAAQDTQAVPPDVQAKNQAILAQFPDENDVVEGKVYRQEFDGGGSSSPSFRFLTIERPDQPSKVLLEIPDPYQPFTYIELSPEVVTTQHALAEALSSPGVISLNHLKTTASTPFRQALQVMKNSPQTSRSDFFLLDDIQCNMPKGMTAMRNDLLVEAVEQRAAQVLPTNPQSKHNTFLVFKDETGQESVVLRVMDNYGRLSLNGAVYIAISPELVKAHNRWLIDNNDTYSTLIYKDSMTPRDPGIGPAISDNNAHEYLLNAFKSARTNHLEIPGPSNAEAAIALGGGVAEGAAEPHMTEPTHQAAEYQ